MVSRSLENAFKLGRIQGIRTFVMQAMEEVRVDDMNPQKAQALLLGCLILLLINMRDK